MQPFLAARIVLFFVARKQPWTSRIQDEIYQELVESLNETCDDCLKDDFTLDYLKENWNVYGIAIYDDYVEFTIGIDAAKNPEDDSNYYISISVDYSTQEPEVSFEVVW